VSMPRKLIHIIRHAKQKKCCDNNFKCDYSNRDACKKSTSWVDDPRGKNDNTRPAQSSKTRNCGNFLTKSSWKFHLNLELESSEQEKM
jgi:hypothetical protein